MKEWIRHGSNSKYTKYINTFSSSVMLINIKTSRARFITLIDDSIVHLSKNSGGQVRSVSRRYFLKIGKYLVDRGFMTFQNNHIPIFIFIFTFSFSVREIERKIRIFACATKNGRNCFKQFYLNEFWQYRIRKQNILITNRCKSCNRDGCRYRDQESFLLTSRHLRESAIRIYLVFNLS